ncbi:MAG: helix-turn-helix transcriptional regulator [Polyangiaceae bacterium]|nr:helix-turn-helix transcriptional regulator [Polyangiaceae bacterium]
MLFLENPPAVRATRSLSAAEVQTLTLAARGLTNKLVAYGLGISPVAASRRLESIAVKVGLMSRSDLVRVASILTRDPRSEAPDAVLTTAEREVLELIQTGLTNAEIARMRSRSVRTVANQVAALLEKTGCISRRGLTALPMGS